MNGSPVYLPTLIALAVSSAMAGTHHAVPRAALRAALALFLVAPVLRTLDGAACAVWPYGTHAAWHLLTALKIAAVLQALSAPAAYPDTAEAASRDRP